jgi:hypothetical protein
MCYIYRNFCERFAAPTSKILELAVCNSEPAASVAASDYTSGRIILLLMYFSSGD